MRSSWWWRPTRSMPRREPWPSGGARAGHLDALERIDRVDGHRIRITPVADRDDGADPVVESFN